MKFILAKMELEILALNDYNMDLLMDDNLFYNTYLDEEPDGHINMESGNIDSLFNLNLLFKYLFNEKENFKEIQKSQDIIIYDLSRYKKQIISFDHLETSYKDWINSSGRENTMDEYGTLLGLIGYVLRHSNKNYLLVRLKIN
jgi:hypothetical protein